MFCGICDFALAQTPEWSQTSFRQEHYPAREWYVGYAFGQLRPNENVERALEALKRTAQNNLTQSIIVTVQSTSDLEITSRQTRTSAGETEESAREFRQVVETATSATVTNMEVRTSHNRETGTIYAFAAVKRRDLRTFYRRQINTDLNRIESAVAIAEQLVESGKKMDAHRRIEEATKTLSNVNHMRSLLIAVDPNVCEEDDMQTPRFMELTRTAERLELALRRATFVYMACSFEFRGARHDAFNHDPGILCAIIKRVLEENNVTITTSEDDADFVLTLITSTSRRSERRADNPNSIDSYYANARGMLFNRRTNRQAANFSISDRVFSATGQTPEAMATRAFNNPELRDAILEAILPEILN